MARDIAGQVFDGQYPFDGSGWRRDTNSTTLEYVQPLNSDASPLNPYALSGDGSVMVGFSGSPWFSFQPLPFLWTKQLGAVSLDDFVKHQGTAMEQWSSLWTPGRLRMTAPPSPVGRWLPVVRRLGARHEEGVRLPRYPERHDQRKRLVWHFPRRSTSTWPMAIHRDVARSVPSTRLAALPQRR